MVSTDNAVICPSLYYFSAKTPLAFVVNQKLLLLPNTVNPKSGNLLMQSVKNSPMGPPKSSAASPAKPHFQRYFCTCDRSNFRRNSICHNRR